MAKITLHKYFNTSIALTLESADIESMVRHSAQDDAVWADHIDPQPYTQIMMKDGTATSEGVRTAYVSETPDQIRAMVKATTNKP